MENHINYLQGLKRYFWSISYKEDLLFGRCAMLFLWNMLLSNILMFFTSVTAPVLEWNKEFLKSINDFPKNIWFYVMFNYLNCIYLFCNILYSKLHTNVCVLKIQSGIYLVILFGVSIVLDADHFSYELYSVLNTQISTCIFSYACIVYPSHSSTIYKAKALLRFIRLTNICPLFLILMEWVTQHEILFLELIIVFFLIIGGNSVLDIGESSDIIHKHRDKLCNMLDTSKPTLIRFAGKKYKKRTIHKPSSSSLTLLDSVFKRKKDHTKPNDAIHTCHDDQTYVKHDKESIVDQKRGKTTTDVIDVSLRKDEKDKTNNPRSSPLALINSAFLQKHKIAKPSDAIHKRHDELCNILDTFESTLLQFAGKAYSVRIIDMPTRHSIERKMGYSGAATLLDTIKLKVEERPCLIFTVLEIMEELEYLKSIAEHMRDEVYQIEEQWKQHLAIDSHMILDTAPVSSGDIEKAIEETRRLQNDFIEMTVKIGQLSRGVDVVNLKVRICSLFRCRGYITEAVQEHLDALLRLTTPDGVLNFLTTRKFLGYLNYELIKVFPQAVENDENKVKLLNSVQEYEKKHEEFLSPFSFNTLIEVFKKCDSLAPDSPIGLPELNIILESEWGGKSIYDWKEFLDKEFLSSWPSHLIITDIRKKCIILTYVVLPFFLPAVLKDLTDHQVLQKLKKHGITIKLSQSATKVVAMRNATTQVLPLQRCIATLDFTQDHIISALNFSNYNLTLQSAIPKRAFFFQAYECIENRSTHQHVATPAIEGKELIYSSDPVIYYEMNDVECKWLQPLPLPPSYTNAPTMDQLVTKLEQVAVTSQKDLLVTIWRLKIIKKNNRGQCYELLMNILKYGGVFVPRIYPYGQLLLLYFILLEKIE